MKRSEMQSKLVKKMEAHFPHQADLWNYAGLIIYWVEDIGMLPPSHYSTTCGEYYDTDKEDLKYIEEATNYRIEWEPEEE